ncbi:putative ring finger protein [Botryosphaeria dothidea]|uniref:RBR-type E3 ubiquitin transferase n=1 Tax=Botryosphaeria dothidea TaxID=55169 RepID=A0A8H4IGT6_9PEZI|nr:putative ring finger protein [Botryosphaeria dothidea]
MVPQAGAVASARTPADSLTWNISTNSPSFASLRHTTSAHAAAAPQLHLACLLTVAHLTLLPSSLRAADSKRKASESDAASTLPNKRPETASTRLTKQALPATPLTTASPSMDSDDDFNSPQSSEDDFMADDDSDVSLQDDSDLDIEDADIAFDSQDKDIKPGKKSYEVDFKVYSPGDIQAYQNRVIDEVSQIIGQPGESTAILLRYTRWNKERLIEQYMDKQEELLEDAGLGDDVTTVAKITKAGPDFMCDICADDDPELDTYAMKCGHKFCVPCWKQYLYTKIKDEDSKSLELLVATDLKDRYHVLLTRTYVDDKENLKWCPAPNCEFAVDCPVKQKDLLRIVPTVICECKHHFCFGCSLNDHQPAPCALVKKWLKKCEDDSETANWISANTKECPRCHSTIEKNGGCNHMTCRKCRHEFCWMCMGVWSEHGTSWYNCNRYEEKSGSEARDAQAKSRQSLERYLHYYNRYANHEQSAKLDKDIYLKTERKMTQLQTSSGMSWIEVQFLEQASQALQQCRQTLKWTYAFAYYLARNNLTEIFEDNQKDLEMAVENLSEMFEKPVDQLADLKVEMMDKTSYCNRRRVILLSDTADNLKSGNWEFNVNLSS